MKNNNFTKTLIVIDDDVDLTKIFSEYLTIHNFEVLAVGHNGKSAFELYQKLKPEIMLLDLMMPEYDGLYGLEMIKKINPNAKIIMVTADMTKNSKNKMLELGSDAIVYKPFELKEILLTLQKLNGEG